MQEVYAEIRGTLARTADKKNTTLFKLHRQRIRQERAEKFGFAERPKYPSECKTVAGAKHFLNDIADEIGHKIARISNSSLHSIERDGEDKIRAMNKEIHILLRQKEKWAQRLEQLTAAEANSSRDRSRVEENVRGASVRERLPFTFFGCAKQLPEAIEERERAAKRDERRRRDDSVREERNRKKRRMESVVDDDSQGSNDVNRSEGVDDSEAEDDHLAVPWLAKTVKSVQDNVDVQNYLAQVSASAELVAAAPTPPAGEIRLGQTCYITDFTAVPPLGQSEVPLADRLVPPRSPGEMKQVLFQRKKEMLRVSLLGGKKQ